MQQPLPQVARRNLRIATRAIRACHPSATNIRFPQIRLRALTWRLVYFTNDNKEGMCLIAPGTERCIIDWPKPKFNMLHTNITEGDCNWVSVGHAAGVTEN